MLLNKAQINLIEGEGGKFSDVMLTFFFFIALLSYRYSKYLEKEKK